ncbi:hypothetical protein BDW22DRAFT_1424272 [Trametopsis cervina]|nr:hypothetical protein BDW22DRAFT_1424272 [Trametopsis cervina]
MNTSPPRKKPKNASYYRTSSAFPDAMNSRVDYDSEPEFESEDNGFDRHRFNHPRQVERVGDDANEDSNSDLEDESAGAQSAASEGIRELLPPPSTATLGDEDGSEPYDSESDAEPDVPLSTVLKTPAHFPAQSSAPAVARIDNYHYNHYTPHDKHRPEYAEGPVPGERGTRLQLKRALPVPSPVPTPPSTRAILPAQSPPTINRGVTTVSPVEIQAEPPEHKPRRRRLQCLYKECNTRWKSPKDRVRHMDGHFPGRWLCLRCKETYVRLDTLKKHCSSQLGKARPPCVGGYETGEWVTLDESRWMTPQFVLQLRVPDASDPLHDEIKALMKEARDAGCSSSPESEPEPLASSSHKKGSPVPKVTSPVAAEVSDEDEVEFKSEDKSEHEPEPEKIIGSGGKRKGRMRSGGSMETMVPAGSVPQVHLGISTWAAAAAGMRNERTRPRIILAKQVTKPPLIYVNVRDIQGYLRYPSMSPLRPKHDTFVPSLGEELDEFLDRFGFQDLYVLNLYHARCRAKTMDQFVGILATVISVQEARWFWPKIHLPVKCVLRVRNFDRD